MASQKSENTEGQRYVATASSFKVVKKGGGAKAENGHKSTSKKAVKGK